MQHISMEKDKGKDKWREERTKESRGKGVKVAYFVNIPENFAVFGDFLKNNR